MKKIITAGLAILLVAGVFFTGGVQAPATLSAAAAVEEADYRLTTKGEGIVMVTPDIAYINIGVETEDVDASSAQAENAALMTKVEAAIAKAGVNKEDMKTLNYSIYKSYNYVGDNEREEVYRVSNTLKVTVRDLDGLGGLIDAASKSGANQINSIEFTVENQDAYYQEALVLAMDNAKGKAEAILGTMNKTVSMPVSITETSYGGPIMRSTDTIMFSAKMESASYATPITAGDIEVSANVTVEYDYGK